MNKKLKVSKVKIDLIGQSVPKIDVGYYVEDMLEQAGFNVNRGSGVDLPDVNLEVKTRKKSSNSAHTVASMTLQDILDTDYDQSPIKDKCQQQFRVFYDSELNVISNQSVYDFSKKDVQDKIREAYEYGRNELRVIGFAKYYKWGYFEHKSGNSYAFRIPHAAMKIYQTIAKSSFESLFEVKQ